jgi:mutator protein MutT
VPIDPTPAQVHVVAAVIRRDERLLVARRPLHKHHGGLWEFPGGKVGPNESAADALARELHEELDVRVAHCGPRLGLDEDPATGLCIEFIEVAIRDAPRMLEHVALGWYALTELRDLPLAPADARFVRAFSPE